VTALTLPLLREAGKAVDETLLATKLYDDGRRISGTIGAEVKTS
jgi:hypothetical protein